MRMYLVILLFTILRSEDSRLSGVSGRGWEPTKPNWQGTPEEVAAVRREHEARRKALNYTDYPFNVRVTQGMYDRGYGKVRLSVITTDATVPSGINWDYSSQFQYMWTDNYLHTKVVDVTPGQNTYFTVDGQQVRVKIPKSGAATRGYIFADPCFQYSYSYCRYANGVMERHTDMLNQLSSNDEIDWWMIGGDNFYDSTDYWSKQFFGALNTDAKATLNGMVLGNHDYWHDGNPGAGKSSDQLGIGMTQYYAQDVLSSLMQTDGCPYDWSISPWGGYHNSPPPAAPENSIFWYKIGNMGILGYSGAYEWDQYEAYVDQACTEFSNDEDVKFMVVVGHWDNNDHAYGEAWNMDTPTFLKTLKGRSACQPMKNVVKYVDGHDHTNRVYTDGFKIGANGFVGSGQVGFLYLHTDETGRFMAHYVEFSTPSSNHYDAILSCIKANGLDNCLDQPGVYLWFDSGPLSPSCQEMLSHECTFKSQTVSCGDRISWCENNDGMDWMEAYNQVVHDCGAVCQCDIGPTPSPTTHEPTPTPHYGPCSEMLNRSACDQDGCHSCGSRITWLEQNEGMTEAQAYAEVAKEFPGTCQCDDPPTITVRQQNRPLE